jgi:hypothetical protein
LLINQTCICITHSDEERALLAFCATMVAMGAYTAAAFLIPIVFSAAAHTASAEGPDADSDASLLQQIKNTVTLARQQRLPPELPFEDQPIDFGAQILLADLRRAQQRIAAQKFSEIGSRNAEPESSEVEGSAVVYRDSFGVLDVDVIVHDEDIVDHLEQVRGRFRDQERQGERGRERQDVL